MSYKHMPRLGSAIASTVLSVFSAVSLVGVDKAQAAVFTYNIQVGSQTNSNGFLKVDDSSLTGIGEEEIAVSEGRVYGFLELTYQAKEYYNLAEGARALFIEGHFRGLRAEGGQSVKKYFYFEDGPDGPYSFYYTGTTSWSIDTRLRSADEMWVSFLNGYKEAYVSSNGDGVGAQLVERYIIPSFPGYSGVEVFYTLVDTEAEPVPEPLTAGGTALALAGLSWLKHKKKMAA